MRICIWMQQPEQKVEETGGANFIFVTKDNKVVTPKSSTILPSITKRSLMYVAEHYLGLEVEEREVIQMNLATLQNADFAVQQLVICPVGRLSTTARDLFPSGMEEMGPVTKKLYETLTGIQMGHIEAPEGWICKICQDCERVGQNNQQAFDSYELE